MVRPQVPEWFYVGFLFHCYSDPNQRTISPLPGSR